MTEILRFRAKSPKLEIDDDLNQIVFVDFETKHKFDNVKETLRNEHRVSQLRVSNLENQLRAERGKLLKVSKETKNKFEMHCREVLTLNNNILRFKEENEKLNKTILKMKKEISSIQEDLNKNNTQCERLRVDVSARKGAAQSHRLRGKKEIQKACHNWQRTGTCQRGIGCRFSHDLNTLRRDSRPSLERHKVDCERRRKQRKAHLLAMRRLKDCKICEELRRDGKDMGPEWDIVYHNSRCDLLFADPFVGSDLLSVQVAGCC